MHFKQMLCYVLNYNFAFQPSVFPHNNTPSIMLKAMTWSVRLCFYIAIDALRSCLVTAILWLFTPCVTITIREPYIMVVWKTELTNNFFSNSLFLTCECTVLKLDCALCCIHSTTHSHTHFWVSCNESASWLLKIARSKIRHMLCTRINGSFTTGIKLGLTIYRWLLAALSCEYF